MKIIIRTDDIQLTPELSRYIDNKLGKLQKFFKGSADDATEMRIEVGKPSAHHNKGDIYYAEVNIKAPEVFFRATHQDKDIRIAIDRVQDILEREITQHKDKKIETSRKSKK